nr:cyanophycin synthetase [Tissierella sp.]
MIIKYSNPSIVRGGRVAERDREMKIIEMRALRGPNYYSNDPVIIMKLDIEELEERPTDMVEGFKEKISSMMPSLYSHTCSPGSIGGFYERLERGTWAGHVAEHIAIELQCLSGHEITFGKTFTLDQEGFYNVVYRYIDENTGLRAGEMAVEITKKLFQGETTDINPLIAELKDISQESMMGPSTKSIVDEAERRGIPHIRLNEDSYVQLGQGAYQRRIQATMMDSTSALGVEIADDKAYTKELLSSMGIPVAQGKIVETEEEALKAAEEIGYPVVVKPLSGNHGRGITIDISESEELMLALKKAKEVCSSCIIEKYLLGFDFRILVINYKFVAAALREPAFVVGNGVNTIEELIEEINQNPDRGLGHEKNLTKINIDYMTERLLKMEHLKLKTILEVGRKVYIKSTANISAGGTAKDVTESVHPLNRAMAERISKIVNLDVMGIDIIANTLEKPLNEEFAGVLEVNAAPGFRMHLNPTEGKKRNIAENVVDMLFPPGKPHSIPIVAVTGTNGKTTTVRIITHILETNGSVVGMTSTDAVTINQVPILKGDYSGPSGASKVMMDSSVDHAVLEVARGGILRRGLGFKKSDIGILLNISSDHLGEGGIETLEELTRLKSTVTEAVKPSGYAVFNADDPLVLSCVEKTKANPILFSKDPGNKALKINYKKGNLNVILMHDTIMIQKKEQMITVCNVKEIPITFNGKAIFNIDNVLAAVAAATALGLDENQIRQGLISFNPSIDQSPGRMNIIDMGDFKVVIDYGHNPGAIEATGDFINSLMPGRKIRVASSIGNRRKKDILEFGRVLSKYYDYMIICDPDPRKRETGETAKIIKEGLIKAGFNLDAINIVINEREAINVALDMAIKGDLVVVQVDDLNQVIKDVLAYKEKIKV